MSDTKDNLGAAFAGESQANRKYLAYAKKADALADAGSLGGPGLSVAVEGCTSCAAAKAPGTTATRRNTPKAEDGLKRRLATEG
ncbi:MAG: rubrerythrin family protein, partial [Dehalococcoidia bacterium]|nr:rubrerythrin family protein [Dehalococcoidia bacterium]